ncbi:DUF7521 family protein [Halapricum desulfuricans]|nr:hypothetical protein [Halapricum desulfuricans]QSG12267.1 putative membrane protein [Halapricum desulfuricans]
MSPHTFTLPPSAIAFKTLTLILGGLITYLSYRAYRRTGSPALRALSIGFGLVTTGALLAGVTNILLHDISIGVSLAIESGLTTAGFAVIVYSLYTQD